MSNDVWGHANDEDSERWIGAFDSRAKCEAEALFYYEEDEPVWIASGRIVRAETYARKWADAENVVESLDEMAGDETASEDAIFSCEPGAQEALETALVEWAKKYVSESGWWEANGTIEQIRAGKPPTV